MRGQNAAEDNFDIAEAGGEQYDRDLRGFHLRNGGWRGEGWNQISWRRRKRQEQQEELRRQEEERLLKDTEKRATPLGRMDDKSLSSWKEITSDKFRRVVISNYTELLTFAEDSQLTQNLSAMSYEELLTGMLFPGEVLQFVPPARIKSYRKLATDGHVLQSKGTVRAFFSDKRMFLIHTNFFQHPSVKNANRKGKPLTTGLKEISCNLEDNLFWTAVNLERLLAQTIDCEYKAFTPTTIIVSRPKWAAYLVLLGALGIIATAFMSQDNVANIILAGAFSMLFVLVGTWLLLTQRQYTAKPSDAVSTRSRKLLIGYEDPLHMQHVTLDCEMEEDYALADAFEWIQGLRSVCRMLTGDIVADQDELLDRDTVMKAGQDGRTLSQGIRRAPTDNTVKELAKFKEKGQKLREQLEEVELKKVKPPKDTSKGKDVEVLEANFEEKMESVDDIKARMKEELAERKQRKKEARARGEIDERMVDDDDFDVNFSVVDFSKIDHGMGNKKFTSRFSFMTKDDKGKVDQRWDAGDVNDGGGFWKTDGPSAAEQAAAEKAEKRAAKKEARKKQKEEALAQEVEEDADLKAKKKAKKKSKPNKGDGGAAKFTNPMEDDEGLSDEDVEEEQARMEAILSGKNAYFE